MDWMIKNTRLFVVTMMAMGALSACGAGPVDDVSAVTSIETVSTHETAHLDWEKTWDSAFSRAKTEDKPVMVSFEAEWCVWCKKLESTTFRDSEVMTLIDASMVPLILDVDNAGSELSDVHGVQSLPTILIFNSEGEEQGRINGYLPPGQFVAAVNDILQKG